MKILLAGEDLSDIVVQLQEAGHHIEVLSGREDIPRQLAENDAVLLRLSSEDDARLGPLLARRARAQTSRHRGKLTVGFTYNVKRGGAESEAEFDAPTTINAVKDAIATFGYDVVPMEATPDLPSVLDQSDVDLVFNIAEGWHGRSRESQVPSLMEFKGIPCAGSDSVAISLTLDKTLAKKIVAQAGLDTPRFRTFVTGREKLDPAMRFPLIVKPAAEGSSKGIKGRAVVHNLRELRERVDEILHDYHQHALVEEYIQGREFTVGLVGNARPVVLPALEVVFGKDAGEFPVYSYEIKQEIEDTVRYVCPAHIDTPLRKRLEKRAREIFRALELRDVARIDFRMSEDGTLHFLEANPLPGLTPGYSDLCTIAAAAGLSYDELIGYVLTAALRRTGFARRHFPQLPPLADRVMRALSPG